MRYLSCNNPIIEVPKFDPYPCHNSDNDHNPMIMIIVMVIPAFRPVFGPGLVTMMMDSLQAVAGARHLNKERLVRGETVIIGEMTGGETRIDDGTTTAVDATTIAVDGMMIERGGTTIDVDATMTDVLTLSRGIVQREPLVERFRSCTPSTRARL